MDPLKSEEAFCPERIRPAPRQQPDSPATEGLSGFPKNLHGTVLLPKTSPIHSENPTVRNAQQQRINGLCNHHTGEKIEVP